MSIFNFAVALASIAGLIMVIGGIFLIYKGALVLAATDSSTALSIEWKQDFRLNTQAPGIAFFLIGLIFSYIAIYSSRPPDTEPLTIKGKVISTGLAKVKIMSEFWDGEIDSDGSFEKVIYPNNEQLKIVISAAGYEEEIFSLNQEEIKKPFEKELERQIKKPIKPNKENIEPVDEGKTLASIDSAPGFGVAQ